MNRSTLTAAAGAMGCCLVLAAGFTTDARAAMTQTYSAGQWAAFSGTGADNQPVCDMATTGADGRRITIQQNTGETGLQMLLAKPSWNIPAGTAIDVAVQIDRNATSALHGIGKGSEVNVELTFGQAVPLMRMIRSGQVVRVFFPGGDEPMWSGGLSGTSAVMAAFNDCRSSMAPAAAAAATQPYQPAPNAPAPAASQPYAPAAPSPAPAAPAPAAPAPAAPAPAPQR
jgi:hypothetical protein